MTVKTKTTRATGWGECPACTRTRSTVNDIVAPHRRYRGNRSGGVMEDCPGAGQEARPIVLLPQDDE